MRDVPRREMPRREVPLDSGAAARLRSDDDWSGSDRRPPAARRSPEGARPSGRSAQRPASDERRRADQRRPLDDRRTPDRRPDRAAAPDGVRDRAYEEPQGGRLRGVVAVLAIFLVTLAGGAVDAFFGQGLNMVTLAALVASTCIATLTVRRQDLVSVVLAPPLVFTAVAAVNIGMAPSLTFSPVTLVALVTRGFPTMAAATAAALVLAGVRLALRR